MAKLCFDGLVRRRSVNQNLSTPMTNLISKKFRIPFLDALKIGP